MKRENNVQSTMRWIWFGLIAMMVLSPDLFAASTGTSASMPWEGVLTDISKSLSGPVASAIALVGVVAAGSGLIFMGAEMGAFMKTLVGLVLVSALIISASFMINLFNASSALILLGA